MANGHLHRSAGHLHRSAGHLHRSTAHLHRSTAHLHRSSSPRRARVSLPLTLVVLLVLGASGGGAAWYAAGHRHASSPAGQVSCPGAPAPITAVVAPNLAGVLTSALAAQPVPCARVEVTSADSADMARFLDGSSAAPAGVRGRPDVWIPETSLWLELARLDAGGAGAAAAEREFGG